jgi:hypothetical protein
MALVPAPASAAPVASVSVSCVPLPETPCSFEGKYLLTFLFFFFLSSLYPHYFSILIFFLPGVSEVWQQWSLEEVERDEKQKKVGTHDHLPQPSKRGRKVHEPLPVPSRLFHSCLVLLSPLQAHHFLSFNQSGWFTTHQLESGRELVVMTIQ